MTGPRGGPLQGDNHRLPEDRRTQLWAGHAYRAQQADFAGALGYRQRQCVRNAQQRDEDRQAEQGIHDREQLLEDLVCSALYCPRSSTLTPG